MHASLVKHFISPIYRSPEWGRLFWFTGLIASIIRSSHMQTWFVLGETQGDLLGDAIPMTGAVRRFQCLIFSVETVSRDVHTISLHSMYLYNGIELV